MAEASNENAGRDGTDYRYGVSARDGTASKIVLPIEITWSDAGKIRLAQFGGLLLAIPRHVLRFLVVAQRDEFCVT